MCSDLFLSISLLNSGFTQKKEKVLPKISESGAQVGLAATDEIQPKRISMMRSENIHFFHGRKQNGCGWSMTRKSPNPALCLVVQLYITFSC